MISKDDGVQKWCIYGSHRGDNGLGGARAFLNKHAIFIAIKTATGFGKDGGLGNLCGIHNHFGAVTLAITPAVVNVTSRGRLLSLAPEIVGLVGVLIMQGQVLQTKRSTINGVE